MMPVGPALLSLALAAGPSLLMVPANPASRATCEDLVEPLSNGGARVKLAGEKSEALKCTTRKGVARATCLAEAQAKAKVEGALVVTAVLKGAQLAVTLSVVGRNGEALRQETFRAPRGRVGQQARGPLDRALAALAKGPAVASTPPLLPRLEARPEPTPPVAAPGRGQPQVAREAPVEPTSRAEALRAAEAYREGDAPRAAPPLAPVAVAPVEPFVTAPPAPAVRRSAVPGWILLGAAVVAAGVAGTFTGLGFSDRGRLGQVSAGHSDLSYTQAVALRDQANLELSVALGAGIGAAALGTTAGIVWP